MKVQKKVKAIFLVMVMLLTVGLNGLVVKAETSAPDVPWPTTVNAGGTDDTLGSLTIHKYKGLAFPGDYEHDGHQIQRSITRAVSDDALMDHLDTLAPYKGVKFQVYLAANAVEGQDPATYTPSGDPIQVQTDEDGRAEIYNLDLGIYYVVEVDDGTHTVGQPFFVQIPMTSADGSEHIYHVHVYPKNEVIEFDKEVLPSDIGTNILTWEISATIPASIKDATVFKVTDTLDDKLKFVTDSLIVNSNTDGSGDDLSDYFSAVYDDATRTITVSLKDNLNATQLDALVEYTDKDSDVYVDGKLYITFETKIDVDQLTEDDLHELFNSADLEFKNTQGYEFDEKIEDVDPIPVGIHIFKYEMISDKETALSGAIFYIFDNEKDAKDAVSLSASDMTALTPGVLLDNAENPWSATSLTDGSVNFYGLVEGEYWIVETNAPAGYNKLQNPIHIVITVDAEGVLSATVGGDVADISQDGEGRVVETTVQNNDGFELPLTGGVGTLLFTLIGLLLIGAAIVIYTISKKKKEQQA